MSSEMSHQEGIAVEVTGDHGSCLVSVAGEIDVANAWCLPDIAARLVGLGASDVAIDLSAVTFVDTAGWRGVQKARNVLEAAGADCRLERMSPAVRRTSRLLAAHPAGTGPARAA